MDSFEFRPGKRMLLDLLRLVDIAAMIIAGLAAYYVRFSNFDFSTIHVLLLLLAPILTVYSINLVGGYDDNRSISILHVIRTTTLGGAIVVVLLILLAFSTKLSGQYSRIWLGLWLVFGWALLVSLRIIAIWLAKHWLNTEMFANRVIVVGFGNTKAQLLKRIDERPSDRIKIIADEAIASENSNNADLEVLAAKITKLCLEQRVDEIVVAIPTTSAKLIQDITRQLQHLDCNINICLDLNLLGIPMQSASNFAGLPMLRVLNRPMTGWSRVAKWLEDKILGVTFSILTIPLFVAIAISIKITSSGPVFFKQKRLGRGNEEILIYKFRTMKSIDPDDAPVQARENDERVTKVGKLLRRYSLDELPQLLNVLIGNMSLVGPRPHAVPMNWDFAAVAENYWSRHQVKPGITGWAQIHGYRGGTDKDDAIVGRTLYDTRYVENWSIWLDLYIILRTIDHVIRGDNAY